MEAQNKLIVLGFLQVNNHARDLLFVSEVERQLASKGSLSSGSVMPKVHSTVARFLL